MGAIDHGHVDRHRLAHRTDTGHLRRRARVAGTGISIRRIVGWYKLGSSPEEIVDQYGNLNLAQVHAALAYYHANRDQREAELVEEEADFDRLEALHRDTGGSGHS